MDGLIWKSLLKWMTWGYHHLRKHPDRGDSPLIRISESKKSTIPDREPFMHPGNLTNPTVIRAVCKNLWLVV